MLKTFKGWIEINVYHQVQIFEFCCAGARLNRLVVD